MRRLVDTAKHKINVRQRPECVNYFYTFEVFWRFFSKWLRIFNQNFTRLIYVHIYTKLLNFIRLYLTLTKLCYTKREHLVFLHVTRKTRKSRYLSNGITDLRKIWQMQNVLLKCKSVILLILTTQDSGQPMRQVERSILHQHEISRFLHF